LRECQCDVFLVIYIYIYIYIYVYIYTYVGLSHPLFLRASLSLPLPPFLSPSASLSIFFYFTLSPSPDISSSFGTAQYRTHHYMCQVSVRHMCAWVVFIASFVEEISGCPSDTGYGCNRRDREFVVAINKGKGRFVGNLQDSALAA
jgi:hypothetical protein